MKKTVIIIIIANLFLSVGCVSKKQYTELENKYKNAKKDLQNCLTERQNFDNENTKLLDRIDGIKQKYVLIQNEKEDLKKDNEHLNNVNKDLKTQLADVNNRFEQAISSKGADMQRLNNELNSAREALNKRAEELNSKEAELSLLQTQFKDKEDAYNSLQKALNDKEAELEMIEKKISSALLGFTNKGLSVETKDGKVYVSMEEKLLFSSGSWEINSEGAAALREISNVLAQNPDISVMVEGHTDNVPLKGKNQIKDNWDLSVMRATSVVKILLENNKVLPYRVIPCGRSEYSPVAENTTSDNRAKNRRTEIILTPKVDELLNIIKNK
ncbi:MAG: OmpA family protein [Bacteroidales bacterium]|jgi:chemotaxis protein MotB|nr:OmpA family protein [Bacteroidales bacterium]